MDVVLDLDLDFFVWPTTHYPRWHGRMPETEYKHLARPDDVRAFLETRCYLDKSSRPIGREFKEHLQAFYTWREWLAKGILHPPFTVIHADAHADLGCGSPSWRYLETEFLGLPLTKRAKPRRGVNGLNSANYLLFAIANRWIRRLTYVYPQNPEVSRLDSTEASGPRPMEELVQALGHLVGGGENRPPTNDVPDCCFQNGDWRSKSFQLKHHSPQDWTRSLYSNKPSTPLHVEPAVPFQWVVHEEFSFRGFTHIVVAQSPRYTPESADKLLSVIREHFQAG